ncbi:uncharacterized protein [Triticum aestivum]|uniref:uncharacterized protein n=1 Tax=Triticum aestivum TaxID=4565 RepID=UPI001D0035F9|nr:uncharacterized protein LOC123156602 [Triticum aestivum]
MVGTAAAAAAGFLGGYSSSSRNRTPWWVQQQQQGCIFKVSSSSGSMDGDPFSTSCFICKQQARFHPYSRGQGPYLIMPASQGRNPRRGDALLFGIGCTNRHAGRHPLWTGMTTMQGRMRTGTLSSTTTGHRTRA